MSIVTRRSAQASFLASSRSAFLGRTVSSRHITGSFLSSPSNWAAISSSRGHLFSTETAPAAEAAKSEVPMATQEGEGTQPVEEKTESLAEYLERVEKEDQEKIAAALKAFESGDNINDHIDSVLSLKKYKCVVFMYGDEFNQADGESYAVIKQLQRDRALFKTFDLNKYPLLKEGLINHKASYVRGDEDLPQVYILGRPFGGFNEVMNGVRQGALEARLRLTRSQAHFYLPPQH